MNNQIDTAVLDVLRRGRTDGNLFYLPAQQLARKLYENTNEVLTRLGGAWQRKAKAHVFDQDDDPAALLAEVMATGILPAKNPLAFWPTPEPVSEAMCEFVGYYGQPQHLLEPSAGDGAIVAVARRYWPDTPIVAVELDGPRAGKLNKRFADDPYLAIREGDFLSWEADPDFDAVLLNPPFAVAGAPLAYSAHIRHAWEFLRPGGRLAAIAPAGLTFRQDRATREFRAFVGEHGSYAPLERHAFDEAGTAVATVLVTLER
jgi:hypothetical protein